MNIANREITEIQDIVESFLKEHSQKFFVISDEPKLLERMVRVEEELKYLREEMKHSRKDSNRLLGRCRSTGTSGLPGYSGMSIWFLSF